MGSCNDCVVTGKNCPYWSLSNRTCLFGRGGIYLPVTEHIQTYCQTPHYPSCSLLEGQPYASFEGVTRAEYENRRGYERVPSRLAFTLSSRLQEEEDLEVLLDDKASTVDISPGGIRFETCREVQVDSLVSFSLAGELFEEPLQGIGVVKWCMSLDNIPVFHAGIAFTDQYVHQQVRHGLGLIVN